MPNITNLGVGSGLQLESILEAYINAEAIPQEIRLQEKEERLSLELSGVGSFKSSLASFNDILEKLTDEDAFNKQVVSSSSAAIDVTSNGFASNGSFNVDVNQLATGTRINTDTYSDADTISAGTLTFDNGTDTFDVVVEDGDDLSIIRDKINQQSENFGVTANLINDGTDAFLVFDSQITGLDNALTVSNTGDGSLDGLTSNNVVRAAQDAIITIDKTDLSAGTVVQSSTNEFKNVIEDLTITAKSITDVDSPATIDIAQDTEHGSDLIDEFINGYNTLATELTGLGAAKQGRLAFDPNVRQIKQQLADIAIQAVNGLTGSLTSLNDIGLEINRDGLLEKSTYSSDTIDSGQVRLDNALENNLEELGQVFASSNGIATQMADIIDSYIATDGVLTLRETSLNERVSGIADEYETLEARLRTYEETLRNQFSFLDTTVSQYNATAEWLTANLASVTTDDN